MAQRLSKHLKRDCSDSKSTYLQNHFHDDAQESKMSTKLLLLIKLFKSINKSVFVIIYDLRSTVPQQQQQTTEGIKSSISSIYQI